MSEIDDRGGIIGYCPECWTPISKGDSYYYCYECDFCFCSFTCYESHRCGEIALPELRLPWEEDEELKDFIE